MNELFTLKNRLSKIGIEIEVVGNIPWIYLTKVNNNVIDESDFTANHGFVIAWVLNVDKIELDSNRKHIFEIIRKYK